MMITRTTCHEPGRDHDVRARVVHLDPNRVLQDVVLVVVEVVQPHGTSLPAVELIGEIRYDLRVATCCVVLERDGVAVEQTRGIPRAGAALAVPGFEQQPRVAQAVPLEVDQDAGAGDRVRQVHHDVRPLARRERARLRLPERRRDARALAKLSRAPDSAAARPDGDDADAVRADARALPLHCAGHSGVPESTPGMLGRLVRAVRVNVAAWRRNVSALYTAT